MRSLHFPPMIDNDPDGYYFNDSKIITDTKYDATEFNKTVTNCTKCVRQIVYLLLDVV